jgi:DNA gyrase subunit A
MARKNNETLPMLDENNNNSIAATGVMLQPDDLRYSDVMSTNFLTYAVSVLTDRALPDVRDGLLPVHRRIMIVMHEQRLRSNARYRKCAKVTGDVMGNYHPHGDLAIYGALVRLAQPFSLRAPLIDGHGNFGNLDGDGAAAARYTECRMTPVAEKMLEHLDEEVLPNDYTRNYDESRPEPKVLPSAYPNLLVNGSMGIAVGMTSKMMPHNFGEIMDLAIWRIANPDATPQALVKRITGPDFPTGSLAVDNDELRKAYLTGEGKVTMVGEAHIEPMPGNREKIVITSLPYGLTKGSGKGSGLLEVFNKQYGEGKWPEWTDVNDLSKGDFDVRIEVELKRGSNAKAVLARMYKDTRLRDTFGVQANVLVNGRPRTLGFTEILDEWIAFRREVMVKIAEKRMREIQVRLHKLEAFLKAIDAIDAVVKTIRTSKNRAEAKPKLEKLLKIDEQQSEWIVSMPLGNLTTLESRERLRVELKDLQKFVKSPTLIGEKITGELKEMKKDFSTPRATKMVGEDAVSTAAAGSAALNVPAEDCMLLVSAKGQAVCGSGTLKRGASLNVAAGDRMVCVSEAKTDQDWMVFTASGKVFRLRLAELPLESKRTKGIHLSEIIGIESNDDVVACFPIDKDKDGTALFIYESGLVKRTEWKEYARVVPSGIVAASPKPGDKVIGIFDGPDSVDVVLVGDHGKGIRFAAKDLRPMGRASAGVRGINLPDGVKLVGFDITASDSGQLLLLTDAGYGKRINITDFPSQGRGGGGVMLLKPGTKYGTLIKAAAVLEDSELWVQKEGKLSMTLAKKASLVGRAITPREFPLGQDMQALFVRAPQA